jgi:hypothetical protein
MDQTEVFSALQLKHENWFFFNCIVLIFKL